MRAATVVLGVLCGVAALACLDGVAASNCSAATSCGSCTDTTPTSKKTCAWCHNLNTCFEVDVKNTDCNGQCGGKDCFVNTCTVNRHKLLIILGSVGIGVIAILAIWIWCCCRRRRRKKLSVKKLNKLDRKEAARESAREERQASRRAERALRTDEIRRKYGLLQNESDDDDDDMMDL